MIVNYNDVFNQLEKLNIVVLIMDYTRPGSDFFQSLTDGHPEIVQTTGTSLIHFHKFWEISKSKNNICDLIDDFIKYPHHKQLFDSRFNTSERWDELGIGKNEYFEVNIPTFRLHLYNIMKGRPISFRNFFLAIHGAYSLSIGMDLLKTKILLYHAHLLKHWEINYIKDFPEFKIIVMTRDLRDGLVSYIENRPKTDVHYCRPHRNIRPILTYSTIFYHLKQYDDVIYIPLKDLHQKPVEILSDFCDDIEIEFLPDILLKSSYHRKLWWADRWSKYMNGFNPEFGKERKWDGKLSYVDNLIIEFLFREQFEIFNYFIRSKPIMNYIGYFITPLLIPLPMKYEIRMLRYNIQKMNGSKIGNFLASSSSYYKRVKAYYSVYVNKIKGIKVSIKKYGANIHD